MSKQLVISTQELEELEKSKADQIKATFEPMAAMLKEFEQAYVDVVKEAELAINADVIAKAKRLRLDIGKVRIQTEKARKEQKEEYLRAGKAIDGVCNILKWAITDKENKLKEIEKHFEIQEKEMLDKLQKVRAAKLAPYVDDTGLINLATMENDVWGAYYNAKKKEHEDKIKAEKQAEQEQAEREMKLAEEREAIQAENERLRKEAKEREAKAAAELEEKQRIQAELKAKEDIIKQKEAKAKAEALKAEQEERRAEAEKEAARQAELNKGDKELIDDLYNDLKEITEKYIFSSEANRALYNKICKTINNMLDVIK